MQRKMPLLGSIGCFLFLWHWAACAAPASNHWAYVASPKPAIPRTTQSTGHPVDAFIRATLEKENLAPSPEVDRRALIRRLCFDLLGLPPGPEEIEAFVSDPNPNAYERLIDRYLASPRYGERWARYWLDVVHFGETHGYDKDKIRLHAWPYRDYVIRALNSDKPFSRFVQEQIAGDYFFADEPEGIVALGFIAAGPWDYVGHAELPETKTDGLIARYNDRDDMVMSTMSTFMSLTVHCARCHDHKFDPISQREYYNLQAVFAGVDRANRPFDADPQVHRHRRELIQEQQALMQRQDKLHAEIASLEEPRLKSLAGRQQKLTNELSNLTGKAGAKSPGNGYHSAIESSPGREKWVQITWSERQRIDRIVLHPARPTDFPDTPGFGFPVRFRIESEDPGRIILDHTGEDFANPGSNPLVLSNLQMNVRSIRITATRLWKRTDDFVFALGELEAFRGNTNLASEAKVSALDSIEAGLWGKNKLVDGFDSRKFLGSESARIAHQTEMERQLQAIEQERESLLNQLLPPQVSEERREVKHRLDDILRQLANLPKQTMVYAAAHDFTPEGTFRPAKGVRPVHLLNRGDVSQPLEPSTPGALARLQATGPDFQIGLNDSEGQRRAALARWITQPENLMMRRSIVNRIWQFHFGRGLVDTPNDFGKMGTTPTHPELLDWLAYWFLEQGESIKQLHRLLLTSATYRQTSSDREDGSRIDADNRLLWRMNRVRLDAECIRDAMLQCAGNLNLQQGGPSVQHFAFKDDHSPVYDYTRYEVNDPRGWRRSIYRHIVRSVPDPFMDCLDAADPNLLTPKRNTTLTALQALAGLNNPFVLHQCEVLADRLRTERSGLANQLTRGWRLVLGRDPSPEEIESVVAYAKKHGLESACRVLFNANEFLFID